MQPKSKSKNETKRKPKQIKPKKLKPKRLKHICIIERNVILYF